MAEDPKVRRMKKLMDEKELSGSDLARQIFGVTLEKRLDRNGNEYETTAAARRSVVQAWLSGKSVPSRANLAKVAKALGTTVDYLEAGARRPSGVMIGAVDADGMAQVDIVAKVPVNIARAIGALMEGAD